MDENIENLEIVAGEVINVTPVPSEDVVSVSTKLTMRELMLGEEEDE